MTLQPAVKKETAYVGTGTALATAGMLIVFALLHGVMPGSVPFGVREIISGIIGCAVAAGNFFMMAVTVQKIAELGAQNAAANAAAAAKEGAPEEGADADPDREIPVDPAISERSRQMMKVSYRNRMLLQLVWVLLAFALPIFNGAAGVIPLFIPSVLIKARGTMGR